MSVQPGAGGRTGHAELFAGCPEADLHPEVRWVPGLYRTAAARTGKIEAEAELQFPGVFEQLENARATAGSDWPAWCWMPVGEVAEVLRRDYLDCTTSPDAEWTGDGPASPRGLAADAARLAALGAWRHAGRPLLNFHPELVDSFEQWPDRMPRDLTLGWPAACLYIAFEALYGAVPLGSRGLFVHLDWDQAHRHPELRVVFDYGPFTRFTGLMVRSFQLQGDTLSGAVAATRTAMVKDLASGGGGAGASGGAFEDVIEPAGDLAKWVAAVDFLASGRAAFHDAAGELGLEQGRTWPPAGGGDGGPVLWLVRMTDAT